MSSVTTACAAVFPRKASASRSIFCNRKAKSGLGSEGRVAQFDRFALAHPALEGGVPGVGSRLAPGWLVDRHLAVAATAT